MKKQLFLVHLRSMKHYFIVAVLVFIIGIVLGYGFSDLFHHLLSAQMDRMNSIAERLVQSDHRHWRMFIFIFLNNLFVTGLVVFAGIFFGILPLYFLITNGLFIGYLASERFTADTWFYFLKAIVPHGIIEIPAFLIASAYGIRLGFLSGEGLLSLFRSEHRMQFFTKMRGFLRWLWPVALTLSILLLVAAVIESTFTYWLIK